MLKFMGHKLRHLAGLDVSIVKNLAKDFSNDSPDY